MEENPLTLKEQEKYALEYRVKQRDKLSKLIVKPMNKRSFKQNAMYGIISGSLLGIMVGLVIAPRIADVPVRNKSGRVIEYKKDGKKFAKTMLTTLAGAMLLALFMYGVSIPFAKHDNRANADKLSDRVFSHSFDKALEQYIKNGQERARTIKAMALILSYMSKKELDKFRDIAVSALTYDEQYNIYTINEEMLGQASALISDFIQINPELGYNIMKIMRDGDPKTYCINSIVHQR